MYEGIEILNSVEIMRLPAIAVWAIILSIVVLIGICLMSDIKTRTGKKIATAIIVMCVITLFGTLAFCDERPTGEFLHQVVIRDESLREFVDTYALLEKDGNIYTLIERREDK